MPSSTTIATGAVSLTLGTSGRTTLTVNGTLQLDGGLTLNGKDTLVLGSGGTLDLEGQNVTYAGSDNQLNFSGSSGSHCTVQSTGSAGAFTPANELTISTWTYCDVSGLADSMFGYGTGNASSFQSYSNVTFSSCAKLELEASANGANSGILLSSVSFTNPSTNQAQEPYIDFGSTALGSQQRELQQVYWSRTSPTNTNYGGMFIRGPGIVIDGAVNGDFLWNLLSTDTVVKNTYSSWHNSLVDIASSGSTPQTIQNDYFYLNNSGTSHPMSPTGSAALTVTGSVFENQAATCGSVPGIKWFLYGSGVSATISIHNNVFLGSGTGIDFASSAADMNPTLNFYNNTIYENQQGTFESSASATLMRIDHTGGQIVAGNTVQFYNNLGANPYQCSGGENVQNVLISIQTAGNNQVSLVGWNTDFGETSTVYSPPTIYQQCVTTACMATEDIVPATDDRAHDLSANPQFVDNTRTVATWDTSLGGPGTEAHALSQMLTGVAGYTPSALVTWVRAGFAPQNSAFHNSGMGGVDIGAIAYSPAQVTGGIVQFLLKRDLDPASNDNTPMWLNEAA